MGPETAVVVMAKRPRVGKCKTRLCPPYTYEEAAGLAEALMRDTFALVETLPSVAFAVTVTPSVELDYFRGLTPPGTILLPVEAADIGGCLDLALRELLAMGFRKAVALDADGPSLPREYICQAIDCLDTYDVVFGPAYDGGYYLIGLKTAYPYLFSGIPWSTDLVLSESLAHAGRLGLRVAQTPPWYDIDTAVEVVELAEELRGLPRTCLPHTRRFLATLRPMLMDH
jgi:hypothetical protein